MKSSLKAATSLQQSSNCAMVFSLSLLVRQITFTKTFVQHYAFIMTTLMKSHESDTMSNRIVHISVQLFSNEELARHVTEECQLLDIMVTVLLYMMDSCLIKSELQGKLCQTCWILLITTFYTNWSIVRCVQRLLTCCHTLNNNINVFWMQLLPLRSIH